MMVRRESDDRGKGDGNDAETRAYPHTSQISPSS